MTMESLRGASRPGKILFWRLTEKKSRDKLDFKLWLQMVRQMKRLLILTIICLLFMDGLVMAFKRPDAEQRNEAVGPTEKLPEMLQKAFTPADDFEPVPKPRPGDWLAVHPEPGQSFREFVKSGANKPDKKRNTIYLQPLGEFPEGKSPPIIKLKDYAADFFAMKVKVLEAVQLQGSAITTRKNPFTGNRQILTADVLNILKNKLPKDAFCLLAITMEDLYPAASWNFVFGQASLRERVGVYSFARYDPRFYGKKRGKDYEKLLLHRCCKVLSHEMCHIFGMRHCIYFHCVLNGSNHLEESDARPLHLCPVCLRKLHYSIDLDLLKRYKKLYKFYEKAGFKAEVQWTAERLKWILGEEAAEKLLKETEQEQNN